jgi:CRISPR-associated protein Cas1
MVDDGGLGESRSTATAAVGKSGGRPRLFPKIGRDCLPQLKERHPFLYLEHGKLAVCDGGLEWRAAEEAAVNLPVAVIACLLLGPGVSVSHEAVKVLASVNCALAWVGEDSLHFYAYGLSPTANTRNLARQAGLAHHPDKSLAVARRLLARRFPDLEVAGKTLAELRGLEGRRQREIYLQKARQYGRDWPGRLFRPTEWAAGDLLNPALNLCHALLYALVNSAVLAMGYSPHLGFIHSGGPLPFTYDVADLYKNDLCLDLALAQVDVYDRRRLIDLFRVKVGEQRLLPRLGPDIKHILAVD